jgi:hypothetical protein
MVVVVRRGEAQPSVPPFPIGTVSSFFVFVFLFLCFSVLFFVLFWCRSCFSILLGVWRIDDFCDGSANDAVFRWVLEFSARVRVARVVLVPRW